MWYFARTAADFGSANNSIWPLFAGNLLSCIAMVTVWQLTDAGCKRTSKQDLIRLDVVKKVGTLWRTDHTVVWEKFYVKKFSPMVWHNENWTHEIFLAMNKKVMFLFIGDSKGWKYFTTNKFHTKTSNGEFFPNYGTYSVLSTYHTV